MDAYGSDVSTFADQGDDTQGLDPLFAVMTGPRVVLEACARRLSMRAGLLRTSPDHGYDLAMQVGQRMSATTRERVKTRIERECEKDERVKKALCSTFEQDGSAWRIRIAITLAEGTFDLTLRASQVTVEILEESSS